jgi:uncharacterized protein
MSLLEAVRSNNVPKVREEIAAHGLSQGILSNALVEASQKGYLEIVNILINAGLDVNIETYLGTPLGQAALQGHLDVVIRLIEVGADVNYLVSIPENKTALVLAVQEEHFDVIKVLIEAGGNVNQGILETNEFPLIAAAVCGTEEIYNYLAPLTDAELRLEAESLLKDGIRQRKRQENVDPLVKELSDAVGQGFESDLNKVKEIIDKGVGVNGFNEYGCTSILRAVSFGFNKISTVRILLEAGANPNLGDDDGDETPLMRATNDEICSLLIDAGADVNAQRSNGLTALMITSGIWGGLAKIKVLIKAGADVNIKDEYGKTALMYAAEQSGHLEKVKLLVEAGADINAKDNTGNNVLSFAKKSENNEIIQLLIKAGASED